MAFTLRGGSNPNSLQSKFRKRRIKHLVDVVKRIVQKENITSIRICDLGGSFRFWNIFPFQEFTNISFEITLVNITNSKIVVHQFKNLLIDRVVFFEKVADACNMGDVVRTDFHLIHSNSVIEHVGNWVRIKQMRDEILRIGKFYYIQTPNYWFPVEPHYALPLIQYLPRPVHTRLLMWIKKKSFDDATECFENNRMLSKSELTYLFPGSKLIKERYLLVKSYTVVSSSVYN